MTVNDAHGIDYADIDPRFIETVKWFRGNGYNTVFAGFIGSVPTIRIQVEPGLVISDARILYCRLRDIGVNVDPKRSGRVAIEGLYDPVTRHGTVTIFNVFDASLLPFINASES